MTRLVLTALAYCFGGLTLAVLAGCAHQSTSSQAQEQQRMVVLTLTDLTGGPIKGLVACEQKRGSPMIYGPCLADATTLAQAVLYCGPVEVGIYKGTSHVSYVHFPSKQPYMPKDVDVVSCVQQRVGFRFAAGIADLPPWHVDAMSEPDDHLFRSLHSKDAPQTSQP